MTSRLLSRRHLIAMVPLAWAASAHAAAKPFQARLFTAGFDGKAYRGGLQVRMDPGWKTYWRVPGQGGIPPEIGAAGSNIAAFGFDCPLPLRIQGGDGESIGYKDEVVFPWTLTPQAAGQPVSAELSAFIGVCETICIPVPVRQALDLQPVGQATRETALLMDWQQRVPRRGEIVTSVTAGRAGDDVIVDVQLASPASDIFAEGKALHFFTAPDWQEKGVRARLKVHGAKSPDELVGLDLRITLAVDDGGIEQTIQVR